MRHATQSLNLISIVRFRSFSVGLDSKFGVSHLVILELRLDLILRLYDIVGYVYLILL